MTSKPPAYGSSAQTAEIDIGLIAADLHESGDPQRAEGVISVDANTALRIEISASDEPDWQLDGRIVDSDVDIRHGFRERVCVFDDEIPDWVKRVALVVGDRLEGWVWITPAPTPETAARRARRAPVRSGRAASRC